MYKFNTPLSPMLSFIHSLCLSHKLICFLFFFLFFFNWVIYKSIKIQIMLFTELPKWTCMPLNIALLIHVMFAYTILISIRRIVRDLFGSFLYKA